MMIAGCTFPSDSGYQIDFDGTVVLTEQGIKITGELEADDGTSPERTFTDLRLVFYNKNKETTESIYLGNLTTGGSGGININRTVDSRPKYIILESSDFWNSNLAQGRQDLAVFAFKKEGNSYVEYYVDGPNNKF